MKAVDVSVPLYVTAFRLLVLHPSNQACTVLQDVYLDFVGRRSGILTALTTEWGRILLLHSTRSYSS